ncbi:protealysin inhibitor emfourin [Neorhizobium sp. NCHU2750]|uniref:protealysin inhibitor emfourin n=1 Tax=Neorhizobium sp. NCHU2750 TaxID=1825976 RepID=UPI000E728635|nr:hypothetical protein NCHU2750_10050 [Neorhizobium sp. NCHU2750]
MSDIHLERLGGFGGFGGAGSAIRSIGEVSSEQLSSSDKARMETLFADPSTKRPEPADGFRYRITWKTSSGKKTIEVPEALVPQSLRDAVKDQLR